MNDFSEDELVFICSMVDKIGSHNVSLILVKPENKILQRVWQLKKNKLFSHYKNLGKKKVN